MLMYAEEAFNVLLRDYKFDTVLDVGCGAGAHTRAFLDAGKRVTACDIDLSKLSAETKQRCATISTDLRWCEGPYEAIWASHVLEHQLDVQRFLALLHDRLIEGGVLAITVPPRKPQIVGGHVSLWNAGLLLYRLVLAQFDCSRARVRQYGYNISVIVQKRTVDLPELVCDHGDIEALRAYFPVQVDNDSFNGDIEKLNW